MYGFEIIHSKLQKNIEAIITHDFFIQHYTLVIVINNST